MSDKNEQLSARIWFGIVLFLFMGSMAGTLQGTLTSVFLDNTVFDQGSMGAKITLTDAVNIITSVSAVISCITTFIMGTLSEKLKNRKTFISVGYIIWGAMTVVFGVIKKDVVANVLGYTDAAQIVSTTAWIVIGFILVMTVVRATSNESVFDAWLTDVTTPKTTVVVESLFTLMGFATTGVVTAMITKAQTGKVSYNTLFVMIGVLAIVVGIAGFYVIDDPKRFQKKDDNQPKTSYWADISMASDQRLLKKTLISI